MRVHKPHRDGYALTDIFPGTRYCVADGCITQVSRYHEGDHCYLHEDELTFDAMLELPQEA